MMISYAFVFLFGLVLGSFLNVCIYRLPKGISIVLPPSNCPKCKKAIAWYDNIPLLSYIILGGKCRYCRTKISLRYPMVELLTAVLVLAIYFVFGLSPKALAYAVMACGLIVATFVDFEISEIPDEVSVGGLIFGLMLSFIFPSIFGYDSRWHALFVSALGALVGGLTIYLMGFFGELVFKKEAMGGGDVKLLAMIGAFIGPVLVLVTFFVAPLFGSIVGIIAKIKDGKEIIPYGPYLSLAAVIAVFWGNKIISFLFFGMY